MIVCVDVLNAKQIDVEVGINGMAVVGPGSCAIYIGRWEYLDLGVWESSGRRH